MKLKEMSINKLLDECFDFFKGFSYGEELYSELIQRLNIAQIFHYQENRRKSDRRLKTNLRRIQERRKHEYIN